MSAATPVGSVVEIVAGLVKLASSDVGQGLLAKIFLDAGLTEAAVNAHVAAMKDSPPPKEPPR
jgi:hypothetical protein